MTKIFQVGSQFGSSRRNFYKIFFFIAYAKCKFHFETVQLEGTK